MRTGIELEEAVELIRNRITPIMDTVEVKVADSGGYIAAENVRIPFDQPPFPRSPLDGFAVRSEDLREAAEGHPVQLKVVETVDAGMWTDRILGPGEAVRIMTGAPITMGADAILRQEDIIGWDPERQFVPFRDGDVISTEVYLKPLTNYVFQGEDMQVGTEILEKNAAITYVEQGILASSGRTEVLCFRKPRVSVFAAGDELIEPGESLSPGKIYDSNLTMMTARLRELGYIPEMTGLLPDDPAQVTEMLKQAMERSDLIITSGGVSVGEKDIFHQVIPMLRAEIVFRGIRMKPGSPAIFTLCQGIPMLHLSGNPFAALTTFELLTRPALAVLTQNPGLIPETVEAELGEDFLKHRGRRFLRGHLSKHAVTFPPLGQQGNGMLFSMRGCNCLVDLPASPEPFYKGCRARCILL